MGSVVSVMSSQYTDKGSAPTPPSARFRRAIRWVFWDFMPGSLALEGYFAFLEELAVSSTLAYTLHVCRYKG